MTKKIYIIAGEASGDALGAKLINQIKLLDSNVEFYGVGGLRMTKEGLESLFDMSELSIMGFLEVLPHLPKLIKRINQTVNHIKQVNPDLVITIDSPGFSNQVAKKLQGNNFKLMHYVAPSVWAYKPERSKNLASLYDHLLTILPFEEPYFKGLDIKTKYVGHPIIEEPISKGDGVTFKQKHDIDQNSKVVCVLPGSRKTEISRLLPIYKSTLDIISKKYDNLTIVIPAVKNQKQNLLSLTKDWHHKVIVVDELQEKYDSYSASNVALVKSGTSSLEIAIAKIPHVIVYKVNYLSYRYIKAVVKIKYANLVNLILDKEAVPEFLQYDCNPENISDSLLKLLNDSDDTKIQLLQINKALGVLGLGNDKTPSKVAAEYILNEVFY